MAESFAIESDTPDIQIIQEIYDGENAQEVFENDLEQALENKANIIIVEPSKLGEETARWIAIGNWLHKTAVLTGFTSLVASYSWPDKWYLYTPFTLSSVICTGFYGVSWQFDPCCKYQVEKNTKNLAKLPLHTLSVSATPVVLVRKDDSRRKILHTSITLIALGHCGWLLYLHSRS